MSSRVDKSHNEYYVTHTKIKIETYSVRNDRNMHNMDLYNIIIGLLTLLTRLDNGPTSNYSRAKAVLVRLARIID